MLRVIEDEAAIKKWHALFSRTIKSLRDEQIQVHIGHQGASTRMKVSWSKHLGLWNVSTRASENPYWNAFGLEKPVPSSHIPIVCEINFPIRGIDRRIGGAMAKDRFGRVFAVHRGKIGGGKKGIGKTLFEDLYRGAWTVMEDGDTETTVALIGELQSPRFARQVAQFVRKVDAIKNQASPAANQMALPFAHQLREGLIGQGYGNCVQIESSACDHGLIVRDLDAELARYGLAGKNGEEHDLAALDRYGKRTALFSIMTDTSLNALYTETTKLLLSALKTKDQPRKFLVVPEETPAAGLNELKKLAIDRLDYRWQKDHAVFPGLNLLIGAKETGPA